MNCPSCGKVMDITVRMVPYKFVQMKDGSREPVKIAAQVYECCKLQFYTGVSPNSLNKKIRALLKLWAGKPVDDNYPLKGQKIY